MKRLAIIFVILFSAGAAYATTWVPIELTDPLTGEKVTAHDVASFGGYIYDWPSKFDLVFWPLIDENFICFNPKNGYGAFNPDFENVPDDQKEVLRDWLSKNYDPARPPQNHIEKLAWLEKVYGQRDMGEDFWCMFYRLMAYMNQDNQEVSISYVKKAMPLLEKMLADNPEGFDRLVVLYLLGEYNRRLGNFEKARDYFAEVKITRYKDENGKELVGHPYFIELVDDRMKLMPDGMQDLAGRVQNEPPRHCRLPLMKKICPKCRKASPQ